ncbi:phosphatidylserine/phosphatidylglycerophosphate/cardiolipin synthase family protein (plasmid) [Bacillus sp. S3]|uniref:phospholipase D-like domain-containing protein n=1 Tax=Bacillus sp. S3 TaxID=486398 RepID=UPI00118A17DE|nr:phospholipase D-like domain-containing protein [Bacillus sp. S3]QCJ45523.1 phosphatidylserine/phosphatidylglycerophosphate/cardiolipin synthase family protein [Bacillus sp. S3]
MKKIIPNITGDVVLSYQENGFQEVIDNFNNAKFINIVTYNINTYEPSTELLKELRKVNKSTPITLILNIPARREDYINKSTGKIDTTTVNNAATKIKYTLQVLERQKFGDLNVYFNFDNHAKLVMTDQIAYIGSQNFSDASQGKFELGFIVREKAAIQKLKRTIFDGIKSNSILYATSEYAVVMEDLAEILRSSLKDIRTDIFTWVGDPPYTPEIEILDINNAYFNREKWENFKDIHSRFEEIVEKLISGYPQEFNKEDANKELETLDTFVSSFAQELDQLANFITNIEESMMWSKFRELDLGDNLDEALEGAADYVMYKKQLKFDRIEEKGSDLLKTFDAIETCINKIESLIDDIKDSMINKTVLENIHLIKNYK